MQPPPIPTSSLSSSPLKDNLFVGNIPTHFTELHLRQLFGEFGTIVSAAIFTDRRTGLTKHAGFVRFASPFDAQAAIERMNGMVPPQGDRPLIVRWAESPRNRGIGRFQRQTFRHQQSSLSGAELLLGVSALQQQQQRQPISPIDGSGLSAEGGDDFFLQSPLSYGAGGGGVVAGNGNGNSGVAALPNLSALLNFPLVSPLLAPKPKELPPPEPGTNLHVFHLHPLIDELFLYKAFTPYGGIASAKVVKDYITGEAKGYGFVQFYKQEDAQRAMAALHGVEVGGKRWRVTVHNKQQQQTTNKIGPSGS